MVGVVLRWVAVAFVLGFGIVGCVEFGLVVFVEYVGFGLMLVEWVVVLVVEWVGFG